jgi:hypothetical protein
LSIIGSLNDLGTRKQRRLKREEVRAKRRIAQGVKLCGVPCRQTGKPCRAKPRHPNGNGRCKHHGGHLPLPGSPEAHAKSLKAAATRRRNLELRRAGEVIQPKE